MLKLFFWILLLANAVLFTYQQGYLGRFFPGGHEPERMSQQLNADKIRLIPPKGAETAAVVPPPVVTPSPEKQESVVACMEVGNFLQGEAKRFHARLAALSLGEQLTQRSIQDVASHMVYIPSQGDKEGADKKAGELRRLGINDFYIIQDNSTMRWGISLGVFKLEEAARAHLAAMNQKGVRSARIGERTVTTNLVAFQLRNLDAEMKAGVENIKRDFPKQEIRGCETADSRSGLESNTPLPP